MININKIKNYASYFIVAFLPLFTFAYVLIFYLDFLLASFFSLITIFVAIIIARRIAYHPLRDLIEGKGVLVLKLDSSGIIKPYIATVNQPFISFNKLKSLFDRKMFFYIENPEQAQIKEENEKLILEKPRKQHYFVFEQYYPTLLYNEQMNSFVDKDMLSKLEDNYIISHNLNYIKVKTEELSSILRDFARYVVELTKPKPAFGFLSNWAFWIVVIVILAFLFLTIPNFLPSIVQTPTPAPTPTQTQSPTIIQPLQ
ncbi:MAG: hypothetical protein QW184_01315 [Nanopusillaceae archaeon]